jgi:hypothetical protein
MVCSLAQTPLGISSPDPSLRAASAIVELARRSAFDAGTAFLRKRIGCFFLKFALIGQRPKVSGFHVWQMYSFMTITP